MLERIERPSNPLIEGWDQLGFGAPTIIALAHLCSQAMVSGSANPDSLGIEARTMLHAARQRGIFEIKCNNNAYESPARLLMVFVEVDAENRVRFGRNGDPQLNIRYLDGFRQLCASGLVMHQLFHEFSLTRQGFEVAKAIQPADLEAWPELGLG